MKDLEIPFEKDRKGHYRFFEILPGAISWLLLFMPLILSFISITVAVVFILAYLLIYFIRSLGYDVRAISGYITMRKHMKIDWDVLLEDLNRGEVPVSAKRPSWHIANMERRYSFERIYMPEEIVHAVILATVNESRAVLEPTIESIINSTFDSHKLILVIAYEGRSGEATEERVNSLIKQYSSKFRAALAFKHPPNMRGEIIGKGGNISYAGRELEKYIKAQNIPPDRVLVTTLDSDSRPDKKYFSALTYLFCIVPKPLRASYRK